MTRPSLLESLKPQHAEVFQSSAGKGAGVVAATPVPKDPQTQGPPAPKAEDNPEGGV